MTIDKYTKFILTLIAVGIIGINFQMFGKPLLKNAFANEVFSGIQVVGDTENTRVRIITSDGKFVCKFRKSRIEDDKWSPTGC